MTHAERVAGTLAAFESAIGRFLARVEAVPDAEALRPAPGGGWSIAGIAWHVAVANEGFAGLVDGSRPLARPPEPDFAETPFSEIVAELPERLEAPDSLHPPADLTMGMALARLQASRERFVDVYSRLPAERGTWTIRSILGLLTIYQVGDWATAHVARHNAQAKRAIGR